MYSYPLPYILRILQKEWRGTEQKWWNSGCPGRWYCPIEWYPMVYREYNLILKILKGVLVVCKNLQQYISPLQPDIGPMSTGRGYNPRYMHLLSRSLVSISFYGLKFRVTTQWTHTDHGCSQSYHGSSQLYHGIPWHTVTMEWQRVSWLC